MGKTLLTTTLVGALIGGGIAGALTASLWIGRKDPSAGPRSPIEADPASRLADRLAELEAENDALRQRIETLELASVPAPEPARMPIGDWATREEVAALEARLSEAGEAPEPEADDPDWREAVETTLIDIRAKEKKRAVVDYQRKRQERLEDDLVKLTDWLELSPYQADEVRGVLTRQYEREAEVTRRWQEGADDVVLGEQKSADFETFRSEMETVLDPTQFETFWGTVIEGGKGSGAE